MTKNNRDRMALGVNTLATSLDTQWGVMQREDVDEETRRASEHYYTGLSMALVMLGGDWKRDAQGKHRVFIAGLSSRGTDEYKEEG